MQTSPNSRTGLYRYLWYTWPGQLWTCARKPLDARLRFATSKLSTTLIPRLSLYKISHWAVASRRWHCIDVSRPDPYLWDEKFDQPENGTWTYTLCQTLENEGYYGATCDYSPIISPSTNANRYADASPENFIDVECDEKEEYYHKLFKKDVAYSIEPLVDLPACLRADVFAILGLITIGWSCIRDTQCFSPRVHGREITRFCDRAKGSNWLRISFAECLDKLRLY